MAIADLTKLKDCVDWLQEYCTCGNFNTAYFASWKSGHCEWAKSCDMDNLDTSDGGYSSLRTHTHMVDILQTLTKLVFVYH
jgi:hypothetical protein